MKTAILVIDMLEGMKKFVPVNRINKIMPRIKKVLKRARKDDVYVVHVVHKPLGKKGTKFLAGVEPIKGEPVVYKNHYSSFYGTRIDKMLKQKKIKKLIITGIQTDLCVFTTAIDAFYRSYGIVLVRDCCEAPDTEAHKNAINWMNEYLDNFRIKTSKTKLW